MTPRYTLRHILLWTGAMLVTGWLYAHDAPADARIAMIAVDLITAWAIRDDASPN